MSCRAWELPVEVVLAGGLATLPLAPIADVAPAELPALIRTMDQRIRGEAEPDVINTLWTAAYLLAGLRYPKEFTMSLFQLVRGLKESSTYQAILRGREEEGRGGTGGEGNSPRQSRC